MHKSVYFIWILFLFVCSSCKEQESYLFCKGASADDYTSEFTISIPDLVDNTIPIKYTCAYKNGNGISPPISWKGVPEKATRLEILVIDATCSYMCDSCCKRRLLA